MQWIGRPSADRDLALADATDMIGLVQNAMEISAPVLHALLDAQTDLIGRTNKEAFNSGLRRRALADLVAQSLAILVQEAESVPGKTGESLTKTRTLLEAVQHDGYGYTLHEGGGDAASRGDDAAAKQSSAHQPHSLQRRATSSHHQQSQQPQQPPQQQLWGGSPAALAATAQTGVISADGIARRHGEEARFIEPTQAEQLVAAGFNPSSVEVTDEQLVAFVVDKVAAGAAAFKANKLPQILAALVREEYMQAAVNATKKALDPNLRGHIEVGAFVEWWPTSRFATPACENGWMKELNAEALRTRLMAEALHRQVEAQNALEAKANEEAAAAKRARDLQQTQPKRVQQVLGRLRKAEAAVQEVHSAAMREALIAVEELADVNPEFLQDLHAQLSASSPLMLRAKGGPFAQIIHHKARTSFPSASPGRQ